MKSTFYLFSCLILTVIFTVSVDAQEKLYPNNFPLNRIQLLEGPFKHAQDLNLHTLHEYDVDKLLAPYRKEAGLPAKAQSFANWIGLDGHIGGHFLSALAIHYASTGDTVCKAKMEYMISELKACQTNFGIKYPSWAVGYVGGVPNSNGVWTGYKIGVMTTFNAAWVPWYNLHKTYAGLRDAWLYAGNEDAKTMFLQFCDWAINISAGLTDAKMESMLNIEHGGMNEVLADAYQITGDVKYLTAAKRFSHKLLLNSMALRVDNLDNMHANTQVPKAIGFQRIAELSKEANYVKAGKFFWESVTTKRSLASGGNSRKEYFPAASAAIDYINSVEGPESCNSNNMLKLTQDLFRVTPSAAYMDYYERAMLNHILSTQHPEHGGYVYFTPARPQHYRVYSAPNKAMWCCVGTGMENHGKYGEMIYTHRNDSLYLNLFVASELNWQEKSVQVKQETNFPEEEKTQLTISAASPTEFSLMVRHPYWVKTNQLKIVINGDTQQIASSPSSFVAVRRTWNNGDVVKIHTPMYHRIEQMNNLPGYVALMYGPVLLGAKTGTEDLTGLVADDSRWGHIANGSLLSLDKAPVLVGSKADIPLSIQPVAGKPLTFTAPALFVTAKDSALVLEPFYKIHDARYMMYWLNLTKAEYQTVLDNLAAAQKEALALEERTLDKVAPGEQQPEVDHKMQTLNSFTGSHQNEFWRDARNGGFVSYSMLTRAKKDLSLMVRYWGAESGSRSFNIFVDGVKVATENLVGKWNKSQFMQVEYQIPNSLTEGKDTITVKFQGTDANQTVGGLFYVRLLKPAVISAVNQVVDVLHPYKVFAVNDKIFISGDLKKSTVSVYDLNGKELINEQIDGLLGVLPGNQPGVKIVKIKNKDYTISEKVLIE